jgi:hypothetical protein
VSRLRDFCATCLEWLTNESYDQHYESGHDVVAVLPESTAHARPTQTGA